jgi:DNA excision repair protein ERCC-6-like 2
MRKTGDDRDFLRRYHYVSGLQDQESWKKEKKLPAADSRWPTCLIVAPSTVVRNWEREFDTVGHIILFIVSYLFMRHVVGLL